VVSERELLFEGETSMVCVESSFSASYPGSTMSAGKVAECRRPDKEPIRLSAFQSI
jgi:hypothetical protein